MVIQTLSIMHSVRLTNANLGLLSGIWTIFHSTVIFVEIDKNNNNADIFDIFSHLHTVVIIEKAHKRNLDTLVQ